MSTLRISWLGRSLLARGSTPSRVAGAAFFNARTPISRRSFASGPRLLQEVSSSEGLTAQSTTSTASENDIFDPHAQGIVLLNIPKTATKPEIEAIFKKHRLSVTKIQIRMDRFTFENDRLAFVLFPNGEQAAKAISIIEAKTALGTDVGARLLLPDFTWGCNVEKPNGIENKYPHYVFHSKEGIRRAGMPLYEGRRLQLRVQTPGWGKPNKSVGCKESRPIIEKHFEQFGIESISLISPNFGPKKAEPQFLCFIDFTTREGAEEAILKLHDTEIEGLRVALCHVQISPSRAFQMRKLDPGLLKKLQEQRLAPRDERIKRTMSERSSVRPIPPKYRPKQSDQKKQKALA